MNYLKKLSTAQMIEQLGFYDTAVNQSGYQVGYDQKGNLLMWEKGKEKPGIKEGNEFTLYFPYVRKDHWEIQHHFVDFDEAMKVHAEEKKTVVYYHDENLQYRFEYGTYGNFQPLANDGIELKDLVDGKWIIEP